MTPRPFDERAVLCDNPLAVTNFRVFMFAPLLALLAASGCEKTNDVPHLKDEALATAKDYQQRFEELTRRADMIGRRANALPLETPNSVDARRVFARAMAGLEEYRGYLQQVPTRVQAGVTNGSPDELPKLIDELHKHLEDGVIDTTWGLSAVESWVAVAEQRRSAPQPSPAASPTETVPEGSPPIDPASGAPIR